MRALLHAFCVILSAFILLAHAPAAFAQSLERETIEIGLSTDEIFITSDFSGADLTIFGALDNGDPLVQRQGRYDIVVVLEGPERPVTIRKKTRYLGIWINGNAEMFEDVPISYAVSSTRPLRDITDERSYRQLMVGINNIRIAPAGNEDPVTADFAEAVRNIKRNNNLYNERIGDVVFLSQNLFRATLTIPANVPTGLHKARAFLFRSGQFVMETSTGLQIRKAGIEQAISVAARENGLLYGFFCVFLAMVTGWLGRVMFRKD